MSKKIHYNIFDAADTITNLRHPNYRASISDWQKFRLTSEGGRAFIDKYLQMHSSRENVEDFNIRKSISCTVAHAKSNLVDIRNSIYQRMSDIIRTGGAASYRKAIVGDDGGVDLAGANMKKFIGTEVLPELIALGKVGIFIDKKPIPESATKANVMGVRPYLYIYRTEDILSWQIVDQVLTVLLLRDHVTEDDPVYNLPKSLVVRYRHLQLTENGVVVKIFNADGSQIEETIIKLNRIPFVICALSNSLLEDVADYQIALTNMNSADIYYSLKSNFPFYVEQYDPLTDLSYLKSAANVDNIENGSDSESKKAKDPQTQVGATHGRRYPKGLESPKFIHPGAEPLRASMEKQDILVAEVRRLMNLSLSSIKPQRSSAESKEFDDRGLESGLSYIGLELEYGEKQIADIWSLYEGASTDVLIKYPATYALKSDKQRLDEANEYLKIGRSVPVTEYRREIAKHIVRVLLENKISSDLLEIIIKKIDTLPVPLFVMDDLRKDVEASILSTELAASLSGYPPDDIETAKKEHADRAFRIMEAQSKAKIESDSSLAARGIEDLDPDKKSGKIEKDLTTDRTLDPDLSKKVRGDGK